MNKTKLCQQNIDLWMQGNDNVVYYAEDTILKKGTGKGQN